MNSFNFIPVKKFNLTSVACPYHVSIDTVQNYIPFQGLYPQGRSIEISFFSSCIYATGLRRFHVLLYSTDEISKLTTDALYFSGGSSRKSQEGLQPGTKFIRS